MADSGKLAVSGQAEGGSPLSPSLDRESSPNSIQHTAPADGYLPSGHSCVTPASRTLKNQFYQVGVLVS